MIGQALEIGVVTFLCYAILSIPGESSYFMTSLQEDTGRSGEGDRHTRPKLQGHVLLTPSFGRTIGSAGTW